MTLRDDKIAPLSGLSEALRNKLDSLGSPKGDGKKGEGGANGGPNKGDGTGSDSARARTMRWVIVFRTSGQERVSAVQVWSPRKFASQARD